MLLNVLVVVDSIESGRRVYKIRDGATSFHAKFSLIGFLGGDPSEMRPGPV